MKNEKVCLKVMFKDHVKGKFKRKLIGGFLYVFCNRLFNGTLNVTLNGLFNGFVNIFVN